MAYGAHFTAADSRSSANPDVSATALYDLITFGVYSVFGGRGLAIGKALLVAVIGLVLVSLSRTGPRWWTAAACSGLALLAMGARLLLQPAIFSYLFLALTFWLLWRRPRLPPIRDVLRSPLGRSRSCSSSGRTWTVGSSSA